MAFVTVICSFADGVGGMTAQDAPSYGNLRNDPRYMICIRCSNPLAYTLGLEPDDGEVDENFWASAAAARAQDEDGDGENALAES